MTTPPTHRLLTDRITAQFYGVAKVLDPIIDGEFVPSDRRMSRETTIKRLTGSMQNLSLAMVRMDKLEKRYGPLVYPQGLKERMAATFEAMGVSEERMPSPPAENGQSEEPIKRRRGGQPGNANAARHGRYSAAQRAERKRLRRLIADTRELGDIARELIKANEKGAG